MNDEARTGCSTLGASLRGTARFLRVAGLTAVGLPDVARGERTFGVTAFVGFAFAFDLRFAAAIPVFGARGFRRPSVLDATGVFATLPFGVEVVCRHACGATGPRPLPTPWGARFARFLELSALGVTRTLPVAPGSRIEDYERRSSSQARPSARARRRAGAGSNGARCHVAVAASRSSSSHGAPMGACASRPSHQPR